MLERLTVNYQGKPSYDIVFTDTFMKLSDEIKSLNFMCKRVCIVTDTNVDKLYADEVSQIFSDMGFRCVRYLFPAGEAAKTLDTVKRLYALLIKKQFSRQDLLVALGGGVTGDLCGFAAATYLRGLDFIQIPTTLLAQVDSSIGGKTGVDFDGYKNMVGAFKMPKLVYTNISTIQTLPEREYYNGFAEVMKHGLIKDVHFYEWLIENMGDICDCVPAVMLEMIRTSCMIKKMVVEKDPHDKGLRAILNFGHTVGHALEKSKDFSLLHGECVALGAVAAAFISWQKGYLNADEYYEIRDMFVPFGLPISIDGITAQDVMKLVKSDKKSDGEMIQYILLKKAGKAFIDTSVTDEEILNAIEELIWK